MTETLKLGLPVRLPLGFQPSPPTRTEPNDATETAAEESNRHSNLQTKREGGTRSSNMDKGAPTVEGVDEQTLCNLPEMKDGDANPKP